jgi:serine/threonine protein kinase
VNNLREIQALRKLAPHPNIVNLEEVLFDEPTGRLAMVFELMDANLYDLISGKLGIIDSIFSMLRMFQNQYQTSHQMFFQNFNFTVCRASRTLGSRNSSKHRAPNVHCSKLHA